VTVARVLTYGLIGGVLAALAAIIGLGAGLLAAHVQATSADVGAQAIARVIGGAAVAGAALGGFGALLGTITREPTVAAVAVVLPSLIAAPLPAVSPYLPFGLAEQLLGGSGTVAGPVAMIMLLAYLAITAVLVRQWALPRDLT
jgi:ABC-type transport system involved in multi-copper enzyme maturation permease subunit